MPNRCQKSVTEFSLMLMKKFRGGENLGNYLIHRSDERKDHKYIARVPLKKQINNKKYRYFYDLDSYKAYMKKRDVDKIKKVNEKESTKDNKSKIEFFIEEKLAATIESLPKLTSNDEKVKKTISDNKEKKVKDLKKESKYLKTNHKTSY